MRVFHAFEPVFNRDSRVLLLGTMPSPKSRENGFYYGHPRNRFWKVLADILGRQMPETVEEKKAMLLENGIAVWDVLKSCEIDGADDSSIKNCVPNDLESLLKQTSIKEVFATGTKAGALYKKHCFPVTKVGITVLPSTSPANMKVSYDDMVKSYSCILEYLR